MIGSFFSEIYFIVGFINDKPSIYLFVCFEQNINQAFMSEGISSNFVIEKFIRAPNIFTVEYKNQIFFGYTYTTEIIS